MKLLLSLSLSLLEPKCIPTSACHKEESNRIERVSQSLAARIARASSRVSCRFDVDDTPLRYTTTEAEQQHQHHQHHHHHGVIIIEPFHGGSHKQLVELLVAHVVPHALVLTLPARKWKWCVLSAPLTQARTHARVPRVS